MVEEGEEDVCEVLLHEHGGDFIISKSNPLAPVPLKQEDIFVFSMKMYSS